MITQMLIIRLSTATGVCLLLAGLAGYQQAAQDPAVSRARELLGERWYELSLAEERFGYWLTRTERDPQGRWVFFSEQRSALNPEDPVTITTQRVFAAKPPYQLVEASYSQRRRTWQESTHIESSESGYLGHRHEADAGSRSEPVVLDWQYSLRDYLDFEVWLAAEKPSPGSVRAINALEFSRLDVVPRQLRVAARNAVGYQIENPAPQAATLIQLDTNLAPYSVRLAGLFDLTLSTREAALAPGSQLHSASYYIPVDQSLRDHTRIEWLDLTVDSNLPADRLWQQAHRVDGQWVLPLRANTQARKSAKPATGASLGYPLSNPRISALAQRAVGRATAAEQQLPELVAFVHNYLRYQPGSSAASILSLLDNPVGDCTEFAELLTTLARYLGMPARTVFGLAYSESSRPAFVFHAWNEVQVDGRWRVVDPTWNQLRVDATHIPLPDNETAALQLLTGGLDIRFSVRDFGYFAD
jgi:transglutaminase-like putative cysteine protease